MTGGLLQLRYRRGSENICRNPQNLFKSVFKSYANFGTENINLSYKNSRIG